MNIVSITIKNSYAHRNTTIKFADGVNYILGKNESGKSEALDMIAYALFGTPALRTAASEYKSLEVTMTFKVGSKTYIVDRAKKTTLVEVVVKGDVLGTEDIATSKTAVNQAIIDLLGYNLDVFNKLNFSKQLEGSAFANATKASRLELINKINGVDEATSLETFLEKKRKSLRSEIKGLSLNDNLQNLSFKPNKDYDSLGPDALVVLAEESVQVFKDITSSERMLTAYSMIPKLDSNLSAKAQPLLVKTYISPVDGLSYNPQDYYEILQALAKERDQLDLEIQKGDAYIKKYAVYSKKGGLIQDYEVSDEEAIIANNKLYEQKEALLAKGDIECPHCLAQFPLMAKALEAFSGLGKIYSPDGYTEAEVIKARQYLNLYEQPILEFCNKRPSLVAREQLLTELTEDAIMRQVWEEADTLYKYHSHKNAYDAAVLQFKAQFGELPEEGLAELKTTLEQDRKLLNEISTKRTAIESYQKEKAVYDSARDAQAKLEAFVEERAQKISAYGQLIDESKRIKLEIQNSCIPTLNKKASQIINKMTGGEHYSLTLSDTFELLLDGRSISAYSGSAQVTANVAFRIALIEMFYKKSFPLFIGDEVDSFADATRAAHIHESLKTLESDGYQVILISHHALSFEGNVIDLNKLKKV